MVQDDRLSGFDRAVDAFRESSYDMHGPGGLLSGSDHTLRAHAGQTAYDVFACCDTFRSAYRRMHDEMRLGLRKFEDDFAGWPRGENLPEEAYDAFWTDFRLRQAAQLASEDKEALLDAFNQRLEGRDATAAFTVAFKALYLFVRAHQDSLCALVMLVQQPRGTTPGQYNMTQHLRRDGIARGFIRREIPGYEEWYFRWRDARNKVKRGVNFGMSGSWEELGISFSTFIPEGGGVMTDVSEVVRLTELIEALDKSTQLHEAISACALLASEDRQT